jgi:hypothetical protein
MAFARKTVTNYVFTRGSNTTAIGGGGGGSSGGGSGGSSGGGSSSGGGTTSGNGCAEIEALMNSTLVKDIGLISQNYSSGAFETIKTQLTQMIYNNYSTGLYTARKPLNATYEKIRKVILTNLEGLLQSINLYNVNKDVTYQRDAYKITADKFNDASELIAQLNMLRGSISLFPEQHITVIPVQIKIEYLTYIQTYGYPENGIWDPDLLGAILLSIGPTNVV